MKAYPYIVQGNNIVIVIDGKSHTISKTHITYNQVKDAIVAGDWAKVKDIIEPKKVVLSYGKGNVSIQGETLLWKGQELNSGLAVRMINMLKEGFPIDPMVAFMENLMKNPSKRSVTELYGFLETGKMPITPDGCFLAYKKVKSNYMDVHSGTVLNKPADKMTAEEVASLVVKQFGKKKEVKVEIVNGETVISMERNMVNDDKDQTCSEGLHFCSEEYLSNFSGSRVVILKINPADVVSIPSDYSNTKGRTAKYTVIGEVGVDSAVDDKQFTQSVQSTAQSLAPKASGPKLGTSAFYKGYSAGFNGEDFDDSGLSGQDYINYGEGFDKGQDDKEFGNEERYRFIQDGTSVWPTPR